MLAFALEFIAVTFILYSMTYNYAAGSSRTSGISWAYRTSWTNGRKLLEWVCLLFVNVKALKMHTFLTDTVTSTGSERGNGACGSSGADWRQHNRTSGKNIASEIEEIQLTVDIFVIYIIVIVIIPCVSNSETDA